MRVLYLHGVSGGAGRRVECLRRLHREHLLEDVLAPRFEALNGVSAALLPATLPGVLAQAQKAFDAFQPGLVVGVSIGARVALDLRNRAHGHGVPLLLVAPACAPLCRLGVAFVRSRAGRPSPCQTLEAGFAERVPAGSTILHCTEDSLLGTSIARGLAAGREDVTLVELPYSGAGAPWEGGAAHRFNYPEALQAFECAVRRYAGAGA